EKKSELVDACSQWFLNKETLKRLEALFQSGAVPEARILEARRNEQASAIAVAKAERTLQAWRLTEGEIAAVRQEAEHLSHGKQARDPARERTGARVEVRAPLAGTILEKNANVGGIVDTTADLFKVADLSRLTVLAHAYEEDLPALLALPRPIRWSI